MVGVVKNGQVPKDCVSHKWFDELSRLIEWFLHADSDKIIFYSTLYLWHLNAGRPLQLCLARACRRNSLCAKWPQNKFFLLILKTLSLIFETYLNENWFCLEFDLTGGSDLGFTTRFWISVTEFFVTMNSFTITMKWKSRNLSMDLWHSNEM